MDGTVVRIACLGGAQKYSGQSITVKKEPTGLRFKLLSYPMDLLYTGVAQGKNNAMT